MKKKILSMLLCAAMVAAMVVGCGSSEEASSEEAATTEEAKAGDVNGDGKIVVGYISKNIVDPFHAPINDYAKATLDAMVEDGTIDEWTGVLDGETDANKQIDRATDCISKAGDYVIILPAEATASDPAVTQMADAGIKVIVVNSKTDSTDTAALAYCGPDDVRAGEMLAEWVVENCPEGGKYAHCQGVIGNSAQIQRGEGMAKVMADHPEFELIQDFPCDWQADKAANVAADMMNQYGDELVAIICDNDDMSSAAQTACNSMGRSDIICVGVDGNQHPLEMIRDGELKGTVLQDGVGQMTAGIDTIVQVINDGKCAKNVTVPFVMITEENVGDYLK